MLNSLQTSVIFLIFFSFALISFLTLLWFILAALALGESRNHQKCSNQSSEIRPLRMKPDREQWNIATLCNLGIYSVLYDNCVWLKMSVITDVVCYRLCFMILKNGILLRVQGWDVLRGREWDLQMTPRSRVLSVKFRFISYCRVFFYAVSGDTFFFWFDKFTDRLYFKKKSQVYFSDVYWFTVL